MNQRVQQDTNSQMANNLTHQHTHTGSKSQGYQLMVVTVVQVSSSLLYFQIAMDQVLSDQPLNN